MFKALKVLFKGKEVELEKPEKVCPNCWGQQEYGDVIKKAVYDKQIDVNNGEKRHAFIADFVKSNMTGAYLQKDEDGVYCPKCNNRYQNLNI